MVRKQRARPEIMGSNPRDRARALTRARGLLAVHPFFSLIFPAKPFSTGRCYRLPTGTKRSL